MNEETDKQAPHDRPLAAPLSSGALDDVVRVREQLDEVESCLKREEHREEWLRWALIKAQCAEACARMLVRELEKLCDKEEVVRPRPEGRHHHEKLPFVPVRDDIALNEALRAEARRRTDMMTHAADASARFGWSAGFVVGVRALQKAIDEQRNT
jgi:hypothetical protein